MDEIDRALQFDPGNVKPEEDDEIAKALKFDPGPVGGTFQKNKTAFPGGPAPTDITTGRPIESQQQFGGTYTPVSGEPASFETMVKQGLVDNPITKIRIFAKARDIPVSEIPNRYRISKDDQIEFKNDGGKWQREIPAKIGSKLEQAAAEIISHPSVPLGVAGEVAAGPLGAAGGAAAGAGIRKGIGKLAFDEPQSIGGNILDIALEGMLALGGAMAGKVINFAGNKFLVGKSAALRKAGREIADNLLTPQEHAEAAYIQQLARQHGIELAPHQLYDRAGMRNIWDYLKRHPLTSDAVEKFEKSTQGQSEEALNQFITQLGGHKETPVTVGTKLRKATQEVISDAETAREKAAKPYYDKAFEKRSVIDETKLREELSANKRALDGMKPKSEPDTAQMVKDLNRAGIPTMRVVREDESAFVKRISSDYKRVLKKEPPIKTTPVDTESLKALENRNSQIEKILSEKKPEIVSKIHREGLIDGELFVAYGKEHKYLGKAEVWHEPGGTFKIENIEIEPEFRRKGVGTKLVNEIKKEYPDNLRWGATTDEGEALKKSTEAYTPTKPFRVDVSDAMSQVDNLLKKVTSKDPRYKALTRVKAMLTEADGDPEILNGVKISGIDDVLAKDSTSNLLKRDLAIVKEKLTDAMDKQVPDYAMARFKYSQMSKPIDRLKDSIIGELSRVESDKSLSAATSKLFSAQNMPDDRVLREARKIIEHKDPELWYRAVGNYMSNVLEAQKPAQSGKIINPMGKIYQALFGSQKQQKIMAEALGGSYSGEYKAFKDLMAVFQRAAIGHGGQSMTQPFQEIQKQIAGKPLGRIREFAKNPIQRAIDAPFAWWDKMIADRNGNKLITALMAPDVQAKLSNLKQLTPYDKKFVEAFSTFTALIAGKIEGGTEQPTE